MTQWLPREVVQRAVGQTGITTKVQQAAAQMPESLQTSLPDIDDIERELQRGGA